MKAIVVEQYGKDGVRAAGVPEPEVGDGDVLVKVSAAGINPLVGSGLDNNEIAERLVVTPGTAKTQVSRPMVKLHAHGRAKLVVFAYEAGLVVPRTETGSPAGRPLPLVP